MAIFNSKAVAGTLIAGALTTGVMAWNGQANLNAVQDKFNTLKGWYTNAYNSITNYKEVIAEKNQQLDDFMKKDNALLQAIKDKNAEIARLTQQVKDLTSSGATDQATIDNLNKQIKELTSKKTELEQEKINLNQQIDTLRQQITDLEDQAITEDQYNTIKSKIETLQNELDKANKAAKTLDDNTSLDGLTGIDKVYSKDEISGSKDLLLYLTYTFVTDNNGKEVSGLIGLLESYHDIDNYRESPIKLYYIGESINGKWTPEGGRTEYPTGQKVYINNKNAFDKIKAHTSEKTYNNNWQVVSDTKIYNKATNTVLVLTNDDNWKTLTGQDTDNTNQ